MLCVRPFINQEKPTTFDHLRLISILTTLSRILESSCCNQITLYVIISCLQVNLTSDNDFVCFLNMVDNMLHNFDASKIAVIAQIYLSKVFDLVNHDLLMATLHYYNFSHIAINLCKNY